MVRYIMQTNCWKWCNIISFSRVYIYMYYATCIFYSFVYEFPVLSSYTLRKNVSGVKSRTPAFTVLMMAVFASVSRITKKWQRMDRNQSDKQWMAMALHDSWIAVIWTRRARSTIEYRSELVDAKKLATKLQCIMLKKTKQYVYLYEYLMNKVYFIWEYSKSIWVKISILISNFSNDY